MCQIFSEKDEKVLRASWVPLIFQVILKGTVFNWANILSSNITQGILDLVGEEGISKMDFYMSSYLIDSICVGNILVE